MITAARVVQSDVAAGQPGPEELAPANEDHSRSIQEKESNEDELGPVVAGKAAQSPQESLVIVKTPETRLIKDQYSNDSDGVVSHEPPGSSEEDTVPAEASFAEASPEETTEEVAAAVDAEKELQRERDQPHISVSPLEASEDKRTEEEATQEDSLFMVPKSKTEVGEKPPRLTPEEEKPVVFVPAEHQTEESAQEEQEETLPLLYTEESLEDQAIASLVIKENTEDDPAANQQPLPPVSEEEESVSLHSPELDVQVESAAEEMAPKESASENPAVNQEEQELEEQFQQESFHVVFQEAPEEEAPEKCTEVEEVEENAEQHLITSKEPCSRTLADESFVLIHADHDTEEQTPVEPTSEEPTPDDSILLILPEDREEDASEYNTDEETVQSGPVEEEVALGDDSAPHNDTSNSDADILAASETDAMEAVLEPGEEAALVGTPDPVTAPGSTVTDGGAEIILAAVDDNDGLKTCSEGFRAVVLLLLFEEEEAISQNTELLLKHVSSP